MRNIVKIFSPLLPLAVCGGAWAQPALSDGQVKDLTVSAFQQLGQAPMDRSISGPGGIELRTAQESSNASLRAAWLRSSRRGAMGMLDAFSLTAEAPLKKGEASLATLDGLANTTTIEFKVSRLRASGMRSPSKEAWDALCAEAKAKYRIVNRKDAEADACDDAKFFQDALGKDDYVKRYESLFWNPKASTLIYGASIKGGYQTFEYFDPITLAKQEDRETPWSAGAFVGWQPSQAPTLWTLAYQHQHAFKEKDTQVMCPAGAPPLTCVNGAIGAPTDQDKELVSLEVRHFFRGAPVALSATVTYDLKKQVTGIDVPIYLFRDSKDALNGGLRLGWRDDKNDFTASLFIGKALSLFTFTR